MKGYQEVSKMWQSKQYSPSCHGKILITQVYLLSLFNCMSSTQKIKYKINSFTHVFCQYSPSTSQSSFNGLQKTSHEK